MQDDISWIKSPLSVVLDVRAGNMAMHRCICYSAILQMLVSFMQHGEFICECLR